MKYNPKILQLLAKLEDEHRQSPGKRDEAVYQAFVAECKADPESAAYELWWNRICRASAERGQLAMARVYDEFADELAKNKS